MGDAVSLWIVYWIGNLIGSVVLALLFHFSGLVTPTTATFLASASAGKMSAPFVPLMIRGILFVAIPYYAAQVKKQAI